MLPSTRLTVADLVTILQRRAGVVVVTTALVAAATSAGALLLPNRYRSETLILVVPQRVPESYVKATVTAKIEDRLHSITQEILSRTRLERIIRDFDLYAAQRRPDLTESIVQDMRNDIDVKVVKGDAFRVAYVGNDAQTVMQVTNRLASLFIEENLRDREALAEGTNHFLEAQLADARQRLVEHEKKLEAYRNRFAGELPSQLAPNLQVIQNVQLQIQSLVDSANRDLDRRAIAERQLRETEREIDSDADPMPAAPGAEAGVATSPGASAARQLAAARTSLTAMEQRLGPEHPDLRRMRNTVRELEAKAATDSAGPDDGRQRTAASPSAAMRKARAADLQVEIDQLDRQIAFKRSEEARLRTVGHGYEQRIEHVPARESELAELTRDYSTLQTLYQSLLAKQEESKIAADLERRQIGAQFKLLDPARVAEKPFSPRRRFINLVGVATGGVLGLLLVGFLEYRDRTFNTGDEISAELTLPVLAVVPLIESDEDKKRASRRQFVQTWAIGALVSACLPIVIYSFVN